MAVVLDPTQFNQLVQEVREALEVKSQGVSEVEIANSLANLVSLPALRLIGATEEVVEAPIELLSAPAVEAAADAREATEDTIIAGVGANAAADIADGARIGLEEVRKKTIAAGNFANEKGGLAQIGAGHAEDATLHTMQVAAQLQSKLEQAQVIILEGEASQEELDELSKKVVDGFLISVATRDEAREALLQLRELQAQVAQVIIEAYDSLDQMKLATDQALLATALLNQALALVDELQKEVELTIIESKLQVEQGQLITVRLEELEVDLLYSQASADSAAALAAENADRADKVRKETEQVKQETLLIAEESKEVITEGEQLIKDGIATIARVDAAGDYANEKGDKADAAAEDALYSKINADIAATRALVGEQKALDAAKLVGEIVFDLRPDWAEEDSAKSGYISNKPEVPTLEAIPAVDTLTYINIDGKEIAYKIGDYVRVPNIENDLGYTFYQLYNLTEEGSAVWGETGSGSGDLRETVRITLASNQAQPDNVLIGTTIQVTGTDGTEYFTGTWQGAEIKVKVTALKEYNITVGGVEGYATPAVTTYTSEIQGERSVTLNYNTCVLTVAIAGLEEGEQATTIVSYADKQITLNSGESVKVPFDTEITVSGSSVAGYATPAPKKFTPTQASRTETIEYIPSSVRVIIASNQPDKLPIADLKATLAFNGTSVQVASGVLTKIALGTQVVISFPDLASYKKPDDITLTTVAGATEKTGTYLSEEVSITVSSDDEVPVSNVPISVTDSSGTVIASGNGALTMYIAHGVQYTVTVPDRDGYTTPEPQTFTAAQVSRSIDMAYVYNPIAYSYITINQTITDPATMISGDINGEAIQAIRQNSHRVVGKYTGPKQMTYCRLMDDDGTKYHDGTTYTPQNGADVFMMLPEFYTKATETSTDVWKIGFAFGGQPDATWKKWGGNDLIGVYKTYLFSSKLFSRTQVTPTVNTSQSNFKTYARNRGDGYTIVKHKHQNIMAFLFYAMYGNTNAQAICGSGTSSYPKQTGQTNPLGMEDTVNGGNGSSGSINFWGLENWWGDIYEWEDNVAVDDRVWKVTEDDGTVRTCPKAYTSDGYISKIQVSEHLDTICKAASGSSNTGYCDYYYQTSSGARVVARSYYGTDTYGGVAYAVANSAASLTYSYIGSRLAFMGDLVEAESVAAFAAIPVTNA